LGLSDVVFPAFLFIVGLSIPFAIRSRLQKGDSRVAILRHTILRALALITMGFFMVNHEHMGSAFPEIWSTVWNLAMMVAFFLVWNQYSGKHAGKIPVWLLQGAGLLIMVLLAAVYRGGSEGHTSWMRPHWWGILGLIGWSYLLGAFITLVVSLPGNESLPTNESLLGNESLPRAFRPGITIPRAPRSLRPGLVTVIIWIILSILNIVEFLDIPYLPHYPLIVSASNHSLVMAGVLTSVILMKFHDRPAMFTSVITLLAVLVTVYGFLIRPFHGISKIYATPAWTAICTGISMASFLILYYIADRGKLTRWADSIMPAGKAALTCYMVPGFLYFWLWPLQQLLPDALLGGIQGLIKSLLFAWITVCITGKIIKVGIQLKV
jgi:predicted acyltransferase